ncbi:PREDICTED: uncharacterized protein LOC108779663 [Cyphomyrmex costatus]|uniref:uncharacterized protein LOC108779663 n=1 Tax=Cyphomyrmex costatus TaxID=456900 RepID=UPI0008523FDB|nr:PREDICTED: uncharacterized protein LOC108779663 [Cyphomyrmex costatus]
MSNFVLDNYDLRTVLIFCYKLKKTAAESHQMLIEAFGEHALGRSRCYQLFKKFKSGDFDVRNEERGKPPKKFEDRELQALLDEDDAQTQQQLADQLNVTQETVSRRLKSMGKIQKVGKWIPHELNERQQENRKTTCEMSDRRQLLKKMKEEEALAAIVDSFNDNNGESNETENLFILPEAIDSKKTDTSETYLNINSNKNTYENIRICEGDINETVAINDKSLSSINNIQEHKPEGDRIINISFFLRELHRVFDGHPPGFECKFKDWILVNTRYRGLLTQFFFKCQTCSYEAYFWSHPTDKKVFLVNTAIAASNCSKIEIDAELKKQFAAVNLPCLNDNIDIKQEIH